MNNLKEQLLEKIKQGEISMIPRWQFVLRASFWIMLTIIVAMVLVYLLSFIFFAWQQSNILYAPFYGWSGVVLFIISSPWVLILMVLAFLLLLQILVSRYAFSYKKPLLYTLLVVVALVVALSSFIQQTTFHSRLNDLVTKNQFPGLDPLYRGLREQKRDVTFGRITDRNGEMFQLQDETGVLYRVVVTPKTKVHPRLRLKVDEEVVVFGPRTNDTIEAFGLRPNDKKRLRDSAKEDKPF